MKYIELTQTLFERLNCGFSNEIIRDTYSLSRILIYNDIKRQVDGEVDFIFDEILLINHLNYIN